MSDNNVCTVTDIGSACLTRNDGRIVTLSNVRCVTSLKQNLVSPGAPDESGCKYTAYGGVLEVHRNNKLVLSGKNYHDLYAWLSSRQGEASRQGAY